MSFGKQSKLRNSFGKTGKTETVWDLVFMNRTIYLCPAAEQKALSFSELMQSAIPCRNFLEENKTVKKNTNLKRLMEYAGGFRYLQYASWIICGASALLALVPYIFIWMILRDVITAAPNFSEAVNIPFYGWMAVLFAVLAMLLNVTGLMCGHVSAFRVAANLRTEMMTHITRLPLGFVETFGTGKLRKIVNEASQSTEDYLAHRLPDKAGAVATPIGLFVLLLFFDWRLGLLSLIPIILGFALMFTMTGKRMAKKMAEYQNALDTMSNEAVEYIRGVPVVKTFGQSVFSFKRFRESIENYRAWVIAYTIDLRIPMVLYTTAINSVFVFLIAGTMILTGGGITHEFLLNLLFYIIITPIISLTLTKLMFMGQDSMIIADAFTRIDSVFAGVTRTPTENPAKPQDASVELSHVSFSYDGETEVIHDVSFTIPEGQTVALVGPSGGGKSTLAALVARFFDVKSGCIRVGGTDVREMREEDLMNTVSFVFQNSRLIKATINDNVRMGKPDATDEEVLQALTRAQCMDIIEKLPSGVNTVIGTDGIYLSGGEQQRIALARAFLKDAPILILDEATAFADPDNEAKIQDAFTELARGKTVLMIAHRLSTITSADCIHVVENGRIVESGTHAELTGKAGLFADMWKNYQTSVQWKVAREAAV